MESDKKTLVELIECWNKLQFEIKKNKKIDFALFENTFSNTYSLLSQYATKDTVDKKCIELIATVYLFANTESKGLDSKYRAALVLTERMVNDCVFHSVSEIDGGTRIYVFEARKDIYINFANINESIAKLESLFEEDFWRNL